jgi:hypothetical protein
MEFEGWVCLLLLRGLQRAGFFAAAGQAHSLEQLRAAVSADYSRFMAEACSILVSAGSATEYGSHASPENMQKMQGAGLIKYAAARGSLAYGGTWATRRSCCTLF